MARFDDSDGLNGVSVEGFTSNLNSTATPLGSSGSFTGRYENVDGYNRIYLTIEGTAAGATGTCYIDFSVDGVNADFIKTYTISDLTAFQTRTLVLSRKYYRVRYVNDSTAQTTFRLHTKVSVSGDGLIATPSATIDADSDVELRRIVNDLRLDLSRGLSSNISTVNKFGRNQQVGTTEEYITVNGGTSYAGFLTAASAVRIRAGGDANDTAAGTGARSVTVYGLDENWQEASETIATNGASASLATSITFIRLFRGFVNAVGTYGGTNAGAIILETTGGAELMQIAAGNSQSEHALYTVPASKTAYLVQYEFVVEGGKPATCSGLIRTNADDTTGDMAAFRRVVQVPGLDGRYQADYRIYDAFPEKTDLVAVAATGAGTASVTARFILYLVDN